MGELGSGNGTGYPSALDTDTSIEVDSPSASATLARAAVPNDLAAAVIAIETELGLLPKGAYVSIRAKLDDMMALTGDQTAAGVKTFSCVTDATSPTAAGTVISGGLAVAKKIYPGDNIVMASGKGIDFSATADGSGTATSELFNDYESGTFTPTVLGSGTAGTGTYISQIGTYTKIGNRVLIQIYISWSAIGGAPTGGHLVGGLPYASNPTTAHHAAIAVGYVDSLAMTAGYVATAYLPPADTKINIQQYPTGGGTSTDVPVDNAGTLALSGHYYV